MKPRWPPLKVKIGDCEQSYCKTSPILNSMHERRWFFSKNVWKKPISQPEKTADISRCHHWFPRKMTSKNECTTSILMTRHYPDLGGASDRLKQISDAPRPIRSNTQIWVATCHQHGISQTSFRGENSDNVTKWRLFSQPTYFIVKMTATAMVWTDGQFWLLESAPKQ